MPVLLQQTDAGFDQTLKQALTADRSEGVDVSAAVRDIISAVKRDGDAALSECVVKFEDKSFTLDKIRVTDAQIDAATEKTPENVKAALALALKRIRAYHARYTPGHDLYEDETGVELGFRHTPIDAVGVYVPGGKAAYPSSALMNIAPAKIAGVPRIVAVTPAPEGVINPSVLYALKLAGADEIYRIGGAQAVAALTYGTETIAPVYKITGPGNAYVAEAKRQVFGIVGIDSVAGPSEVLIIADNQNDPNLIALDLLAQAEHDPAAQSILITDDADFADRVTRAVEEKLLILKNPAAARESWNRNGIVIISESLDAACDIADLFAPEHLQICTDTPELYMAKIRNAGAAFLGRHTPEAIGDYLAGPNHVLPTLRGPRFSSGLSVSDFMKRTSIIKCSAESLRLIGQSAVDLATAEGLEAHALSVSERVKG